MKMNKSGSKTGTGSEGPQACPLGGRRCLSPFSTRREFFPAAARYGVLAVLAAITAMASGTKRSGRPGRKCINKNICRGCGAYHGCRLPTALSAKNAAGRV